MVFYRGEDTDQSNRDHRVQLQLSFERRCSEMILDRRHFLGDLSPQIPHRVLTVPSFQKLQIFSRCLHVQTSSQIISSKSLRFLLHGCSAGCSFRLYAIFQRVASSQYLPIFGTNAIGASPCSRQKLFRTEGALSLHQTMMSLVSGAEGALPDSG